MGIPCAGPPYLHPDLPAAPAFVILHPELSPLLGRVLAGDLAPARQGHHHACQVVLSASPTSRQLSLPLSHISSWTHAPMLSAKLTTFRAALLGSWNPRTRSQISWSLIMSVTPSLSRIRNAYSEAGDRMREDTAGSANTPSCLKCASPNPRVLASVPAHRD